MGYNYEAVSTIQIGEGDSHIASLSSETQWGGRGGKKGEKERGNKRERKRRDKETGPVKKVYVYVYPTENVSMSQSQPSLDCVQPVFIRYNTKVLLSIFMENHVGKSAYKYTKSQTQHTKSIEYYNSGK